MNRRDFLKQNLMAVSYASLGTALLGSNIFSANEAVASEVASEKAIQAVGNNKIKVGILLFDNVEVLDFAGPFEVFSIPFKGDYENKIFDVVTVSENGEMVVATNGLKVVPDYSIHTMPNVDIMIIPGGGGSDNVSNNPTLIEWVKKTAGQVKIMASVCTGAFVLAKAGLLDGKKVTTHIERQDKLEELYPSCTVIRNVKFVDEKEIVTSAGISAGIEMSFHLVKKFAGLEAAKATAHIMEYDIVLD